MTTRTLGRAACLPLHGAYFGTTSGAAQELHPRVSDPQATVRDDPICMTAIGYACALFWQKLKLSWS
jgi:hypothetical protein